VKPMFRRPKNKKERKLREQNLDKMWHDTDKWDRRIKRKKEAASKAARSGKAYWADRHDW
jgi:hypothetical protein